MSRIKVGDRIRYMHDISEDILDWAKKDDLTKGRIYQVTNIYSDHYDINTVFVKVTPPGPLNFRINMKQFDLVMLNNKERIAKRMKELNNA